MKHVLIIMVTIAIIVTGIFLPYIHGDYDNFAFGLSYIFQFGILAALLLVPIGLIWWMLNVTNDRNNQTVKYPTYFRNASLVMAAIIVLAAAIGAFASNNRFSAIIILGFGVFLFLFRRKVNSLLPLPNSVMPYYFIFIPLTVVCLRMAFLETVKDNSIDYIIQQCAPFIQDIEAYKEATGYYPVSLLSTIEDYKPRVSGIKRFYYERSGDAYNVYFEQTSDVIGTEEVVMYNKLGEHEMTVHNQDLLRLAPQGISRGYHRVADLPQPHWKIFYFD